MIPGDWNRQHDWTIVLSANELCIARVDGAAIIPARDALGLLLAYFGPEKLQELVSREAE